ncbi:MAG: hypothetical protein A2144_03300 [Chloroflexi bacterium RBG_16_50_9]|nr:MAG: hypothetical protein A2144_03300 [Chloroflexi bacterium RBG_16_50_9]
MKKIELTKKQALLVGVVAILVIFGTGIAAKSWFVIMVGVALLVYIAAYAIYGAVKRRKK